MPTARGTLSEIQPQIAEIVEKVSKIPFDEIGKDLRSTLAGANAAIGRLTPEAQKALGEVQKTLARAQASLDNLDRNVTDPGAPVQQNMQETLLELQRTARALRVLADYLQQHPESILRGKPADAADSPTLAPRHDAEIPFAHRRRAGRAARSRRLLDLAPPPTRLHTLMPAEPTPREPAAAGRGPLFVSLEPIRLPAQVDQPQWLVRLPDESLASLEQERWASPLRDELRQALLEQLAARFGVVEGRSAAPQAAAPVRVALELRRFDSVPGREARIEGALDGGRAGRAAALQPARARGRAGRAWPSSRRRIGARWRASPARSAPAWSPCRRPRRRPVRRRAALSRPAARQPRLQMKPPDRLATVGRSAAEAAISRRDAPAGTRSRANHDLVLDRLHALDLRGDASRPCSSRSSSWRSPTASLRRSSVSTLMAAASTFLSSTILALTVVVIAASST